MNRPQYLELFRDELRRSRDMDRALLLVLKELGYADFDRIAVEYIIEGRLVNESLIHIGAGEREELFSPIDRSFIRSVLNGRRTPFIPGSTLKGVMRSLAESIACTLNYMKLYIAIDNGVVIKCSADALGDTYKVINDEKVVNKLLELNDDVLDDLLTRCLCSPVIGLFGAPWISSHIYLYDAYPEREPITTILTRVAIDRFSNAQRPGLLYSIEFVERETTWRFRMRISNIDLRSDKDRRVHILKELLKMLRQGIQVGARTSVGHGLVKLTEANVRIVRIEPDKGIVEEGPYPLEDYLR